ncbi:MAG: transglutaminase domain-containing protein [Bacteroidia bacterium]
MKLRFSILLFIFCLSVPQGGSAQSPKVQKLATRITRGIGDDSLKVRAIFKWVTKHIRYDMRSYLKHKLPNANAKTTLRRRKAVCAGYAILFAELCQSEGIAAYYLSGYTRGRDFDPDFPIRFDDHAWNAVMINRRWYLLDATWSSTDNKLRKTPIRNFIRELLGLPTVQIIVSRHSPNDNYYLLPAKQMILDHLPLMPFWQLLSTEMPLSVFREGADFSKLWLSEQNISNRYSSAGIDYYQSMTKPKQWLWEGELGLEFNPNNFQTIGYNYVWYGLNDPPQSDTIDYLKQGQEYVREAIKENKAAHRARGLRNQKRNREAKSLLTKVQNSQQQFFKSIFQHHAFSERQYKSLEKARIKPLKLVLKEVPKRSAKLSERQQQKIQQSIEKIQLLTDSIRSVENRIPVSLDEISGDFDSLNTQVYTWNERLDSMYLIYKSLKRQAAVNDKVWQEYQNNHAALLRYWECLNKSKKPYLETEKHLVAKIREWQKSQQRLENLYRHRMRYLQAINRYQARESEISFTWEAYLNAHNSYQAERKMLSDWWLLIYKEMPRTKKLERLGNKIIYRRKMAEKRRFKSVRKAEKTRYQAEQEQHTKIMQYARLGLARRKSINNH